MPTGPQDIVTATTAIVRGAAGAGRVFDHIIWPDKNNLARFKELVGDPQAGDLNATFVHFASFRNENTDIFALDRGQELYDLELHHVRGLNKQTDADLNSSKLFMAFIFALIDAFKLAANKNLTINPNVSHTPLRTLGRISPVSEYGPFYVHYAILTFTVLNGDC